MEQTLNAYLAGQLAGSKFAIHYHIGDEFNGETDFRVLGDGQYQLWSTVTQGRQRRDYAGQLPESDVRALAAELRAARVWEARHVHPRPWEDDPLATIAIESGGEHTEVVLWTSEIGEVEPFKRSQVALLKRVHSVSHGEVLEGGQ